MLHMSHIGVYSSLHRIGWRLVEIPELNALCWESFALNSITAHGRLERIENISQSVRRLHLLIFEKLCHLFRSLLEFCAVSSLPKVFQSELPFAQDHP
jgi:hypothetical protein